MNTALIRQGLPADGAALLWSSSALLLTCVLYLADGALHNDRVQYGVGTGRCKTPRGGLRRGAGDFLVMAAAGGGGFLALAAYCRLDPSGRLGRR